MPIEINYEVILKLSLSLLISGLIGYDRERNHSTAGIKTHIMVGIGSTIIALIQHELVHWVMDLHTIHGIEAPVRIDPVRLIAQVISGIGFLGAGSIVLTQRNIFGITTASTIWVVAALGLAVGMGLYQIAFFGLMFVLFTLVVLKRFTKSYKKQNLIIKIYNVDNARSIIIDFFKENGIDIEILKFNFDHIGGVDIQRFVVKIDHLKDKTLEDIVEEILVLDNVISVEKSNIEY